MTDQHDLRGQKRALIIGISDYSHPTLDQLDFCKNDVIAISTVLEEQKYIISKYTKFVGEIKGDMLRTAIYDFFENDDNRPDDILLFYYSGHGVLNVSGEMYLASTDVDPDKPGKRGFPLKELLNLHTVSTRVVIILDCCYSGLTSIGKGDEDAGAKLGRKAMDENSDYSKSLSQGRRKHFLAASQAAQQAFGSVIDGHSIFTSYLLKGLRGTTASVDIDGNVTPQTLGDFTFREMMSDNKRPRQTPVIKTENSNYIHLAHYDRLNRYERC